MSCNMEKTYNPEAIEERIYKKWVDGNYFHATADKSKKPFTIVIPPPNITGQLHMGHAMDNIPQDILIRWKRMSGYCALWVPGTDHASIATEARIVEAMSKEGLTKEMLGREKFLERAWEWRAHYGGRIIEQLKKLGCSCDWDRERFTMDEGLSKAVTEVFIRLFNKGLIYRSERIINWCPKCVTSISDAEVEYEEKQGKLYYIRYPLKDMNGYVTVATTRPETMLGDTAVAVNPDDERYQSLIGKSLILPLIGREIPVIADNYVEKGFGTGAVKITPAHDPNDFEVGERHGLPVIKVMDDFAVMNENAGKFSGMDRYEARNRIVNELSELKLLEKIKEHNHNVGSCYRCDTVIEPVVSKQWFVKMKPLAQPAIEAVRNGSIRFIPDRFSKIYFNWMENIQDWCISRQLWWGHRIPAYYCLECGKIIVSADMPDICPDCGSARLIQDNDTLDTWFSSALWPFSTLGWPESTEDLEYFYPTDVLVTGYDIIFFWVARMIFSGLEHMKEKPFEHVLIHGLCRDAQGRKMSKSLGNGIDPLEVINQYGTDSLRFALTIGNSPGGDIRFSTDKVESARNFTNKIWNASRFVLLNFDETPDFSMVDQNKFTTPDRWILGKLNTLIKEIGENLNKYEFGMALQKIYDFIWDSFCDWYIEIVKPRLYDRETQDRLEALYVLNRVMCDSMKLLHPFMPFITEEIYMQLVHNNESIMISEWPSHVETSDFNQDEDMMELVMNAVRSIRNLRAEMNVPPSRKTKVFIVTEDEFVCEAFKSSLGWVERLAYAQELILSIDRNQVPADAVSVVLPRALIYIPLEELIDVGKELERLEKEKVQLEAELLRVSEKLSNEGFIAKAPMKVINEEQSKKLKYEGMYENVKKRMELLSKNNLQ